MLKKLVIFIIIIASIVNNSFADTKKGQKASCQAPVKASLIVDGNSGKILHSRNAKKKIYPASLTKVMTTYLMFDALKSGKISLDQKFVVSKNATKALPSKLYVREGEKISVKDCIHALSIRSANDVAVVVAENMAGSEQKFARLMTIKAKQLGMTNTNFTNASGWHDPKQYSTAVDLAKLSIAIKRDFPKYYKLLSQTSFAYKDKTIRCGNALAGKYPGAELMKTGYHSPAGRNLITVATRGNKNLVGVITGRQTPSIRNQDMTKLLDTHFGATKKNKHS